MKTINFGESIFIQFSKDS